MTTTTFQERVEAAQAEIRSRVKAHGCERDWRPVEELEVREDGERLVFQGHAAVFDRLSEDLGGFRERIQRGAYRKVLDSNPDVRFLVNHDSISAAGLPLARTKNSTLELREDPKGLRVYAELAPTTLAKDLRVLVKRGDIDQMSFGFSMREGGKDVWSEEDGQLVRTIVSFGALFDVSPVVFPAYPQTDASMRSKVCGVEITSGDGALNPEALRVVAWKIHRGEVEATDEERAAVDAAFAQTETVSPWIAERAARAFSQEPELRAAVQGKRITVSLEDDAPEGEAWRLAAQQRRLRLSA